MGRTTFFKEFKRNTSMSPIEYFLGLKLDAARGMLEMSDHKLRVIADTFNFCDEYYFSKMFKRKYGLSPSEYRKMLRDASGRPE
jgi:AraC-like DNA-binding protein